MIRGLVTDPAAPQITINCDHHTVYAQYTGRVFFVESGTVAINDVTIDNAVAQVATVATAAAAVAAALGPAQPSSSMTARW